MKKNAMPAGRQGFTLVEIMLATFLFAAIVAGVSIFVIYYLQSYSFSFEETQAIGQAQNGVTTIIREIREARMGEDGAWPIIQADDNSFTFYSDVTNDGQSDRVRYFIEGTEFKKGIIEPTGNPVSYPTSNEKVRTIVDFVDTAGQPLFTYYNGNWPGDTVNNPLIQANRLSQTRFVSVYVRINVNPDKGALPFELTSGVQIRGLKDNL